MKIDQEKNEENESKNKNKSPIYIKNDPKIKNKIKEFESLLKLFLSGHKPG